MKDGLSSKTIGNWGNHLLLKTRRESSSGQAEFHEKQADVIIIQSGQATIIVGGKIINGKTTAPNEIRGTSNRDRADERHGDELASNPRLANPGLSMSRLDDRKSGIEVHQQRQQIGYRLGIPAGRDLAMLHGIGECSL